MKKTILLSFAIIIYFSISACSNSVSFPTATPNPSATHTSIPSLVPTSSPTSSTPQVPGLVKTTLEFYRGGKTYEIIVGYAVGNAFFYATPHPEFPSEKLDKAGANSAKLERYGDFDNDGEIEYIVSLMYCGAYCSESIQIYEYDVITDSYYVADEFGAKYPAVDNYTDLDNDGNPELITANYGFCYQCSGANAGLATLLVLRYENEKFTDVSSEFPELLLEEANKFLESAKVNEQDAAAILLPAYLYNMYRLNKIEEGSAIFVQVCKTVLLSNRSNSNFQFDDCGQFLIDVDKSINEFESER
jgi:hypothetical protein